MMKSFFKKLSLVMALAMVVSAMAPAATASAADALGIVAQGDTTWTVLETDVVEEIGAEVVDYQYKGAPANYKELDPTWDSSDKTVATVDKYGKVTTLKAGETVISIALSNGQKGEVKLTVKSPEADNSFTVNQTTYTLVELTFANKAVTQADVEKNLTIDWVVVDDYAATQPFQVVGVKDGVATINVYGFNDGVEYIYTYADYEVREKASVGDVASIEVKAYADADCSANLEHVAYVNQAATVKYVLKDAKGVDVTDVALAANAGAYVEFRLVKDSTNGEYWLNDMTGTTDSPNGEIWFTAANKQVDVVAKYVTGKYDSNTGLPVEGPQSKEYTVYSTYAPAYRLTQKTGFTLNGNFDKPTATIALDDEVGEGNAKYAEFKFKDSNKADIKSSVLAYAEGTFSFKSTNPAVAFVNPTTGEITTNTVGQTTVLCYFKPTATQANPNPVATLVAADTITVAAKRAVSEIKLPANRNIVVSTDDTYGFNVTTFTVNVEDQLDAPINGTLTVERNKATLPTGYSAPAVSIANAGETGKYTVTVSGSAACVGGATSGATSYLFTYEVKAQGAATQQFTVTVRKPIVASTGLVISGHEIVTNNVTDIKTDKDANAKTLTATVNVQSNAVNYAPVAVTKNPGKDYQVGQYYYTVTKDGKDITKDATFVDGTTINVPLTKVATDSAVGGANLVNKAASGVGTYVITVYKAVGATANTTTQALSTIQTKTVSVTDSQKVVSFSSKTAAEVDLADLKTMVLKAFEFKYDNKKVTDPAISGNIIVAIDAKNPELAKGAVVFVKSVTFYVNNGKGAYTKNTVTINDYFTIK